MDHHSAPGLNNPRFVDLRGGHNFRDIGGYEAQNGRKVVTGRVYRSANLSRLTDDDHDLIGPLGLKVIIDLRSNRERAKRPSRLPADLRAEVWSQDHEGSAGDLLAALAEPGATAEDSRAFMQAAYRLLAYEQAASIRTLFQRIAAGDTPLLFHCAAGKDRTGIAAAILLELLGVPRSMVIQDYLLTEHFFEHNLRLVMTDFNANILASVEQSVWEPVMRAEASYLETTFDHLEARHGSVMGYVREVLDLDDAVIEGLKKELLA